MPNTTSDLSSAHVTLASTDLEAVIGGAPAFPTGEAATAFGQGLEATVKNRDRIGNAINSFNQSGWNPVYNGLNAAKNYFSGSGGTSGTPATGTPSTSGTP